MRGGFPPCFFVLPRRSSPRRLGVPPTTLTFAEPLVTGGETRRARISLLLPARAVGVTAGVTALGGVTRVNAEVPAAGEHLFLRVGIQL